MKRIHRLLYPKAANAVWAPLLAAIILAATAVAAFAAWPPATLRHAVAAQEQNPATESQYQKWVNKDVVYIITPQERAAFEQLKTDAERNKFIEQFWELRNPTPGSAVNTYKQQHYRELAYANQHFATNSKAGWQTDRGHMLILYGPPDNIDSHKDAKPYAYEEWKYRHIKGVGDNVTLTFIDRSGEGDYQLAPGAVNKGESASAPPKPDQPDHTDSTQLVEKLLNDRRSYPKCIDCPQPKYTEDAARHKFQGSMKLNVVITAEGRAEDIKAVKPLPYGLTESAIKAVKKWKFKPANGPDGKPATVHQMIEISFHTY